MGENSPLLKPLQCQQCTLSTTALGGPTPLYFLTNEERMMKETGKNLRIYTFHS
jgi:hypothetical protein